MFGQQPTFLHGTAENPEIRKHLEKVLEKKADNTYIFSAIPQNPITVQDRNGAPQHFPYPIIFIHGLVGSADSWVDFYNYALSNGWSYGGQLRFNLNSDNELGYSNVFSAAQSDIEYFNTNVAAADFYIINFNCGIDGTPYGGGFSPTQSNQAAIVKQGVVIGKGVNHVLDATGKDKVILIGHSMGGLAARQYLQNPSLWQPDGKHHVAKLVTSGTPHGGSNVSGSILSQLAGVDESSDAVRDLRTSYFYSSNQGVFLFGGIESPAVMNDNLWGFYNYDVNCNGTQGNQITGLNQKSLYNDLEYSCIVGQVTPISDGFVGVAQAQIKSYYNIPCETFFIDAFHTSLPDETKTNFEAFDEPDEYNLSYDIETNVVYNGFITKQAPDGAYLYDFDDYIFTTSQAGMLSVTANNISVFPFGITILGHPNYNVLFDQTYQSASVQTPSIQLPSGTYYLEVYALGTTNSWQFPYNFKLNWTPSNTTTILEQDDNIRIHIRPNPVSGVAFITIENDETIKGFIKIQNEMGQVVHLNSIEGRSIEEQIDMIGFPDGLYVVTVGSEKGIKSMKLMKTK